MKHQQKYYIKKTIGAGWFYLSPRMSRWIPSISTKHRFGKFTYIDAEAFVEAKQKDNPETVYEIIPV